METPTVRWRRLLPRTPARWAAAVAVLAVLVGGGTWTAVADDGPPAVQREDRMLRPGGVEIDTSYFTAGGSGGPPCSSATASAAARTTYGRRPRSWPPTGTRC
ncbi:hypothetical protein SMICM304S_01317 [Streptomyces microflavus]